MDLSFHVPTSNTQFVGDEHRTSAQVRLLIRLQKHMHTWCKSWKCEISLPFRCYGRLHQFKLTVGAPQRLLLLHSMELQFLHQGRKIYSWTSAPLNIMYIIFFTKVANAPFPFRGRYSVELHQSFSRLQWQANDFMIQCSSILYGLTCWKCQSSNANIYPSIWCTIELMFFISSVLSDPKCICVWYLIYIDPFSVAISYLYDEQYVITRFCIFTRCAAILLFCAGLLR